MQRTGFVISRQSHIQLQCFGNPAAGLMDSVRRQRVGHLSVHGKSG